LFGEDVSVTGVPPSTNEYSGSPPQFIERELFGSFQYRVLPITAAAIEANNFKCGAGAAIHA
jgi:hypothetical protein